jgi:hypothetical protein
LPSRKTGAAPPSKEKYRFEVRSYDLRQSEQIVNETHTHFLSNALITQKAYYQPACKNLDGIVLQPAGTTEGTKNPDPAAPSWWQGRQGRADPFVTIKFWIF